ncbi:hypothetical protein [Enterococcus mundtii]|uniref:hypothetical protein n=1 Tax=Enterococcus mundtii TaxID=53346 RepID=UPI000CF1BB27|nr:hypothetical protein [Enterococcus mundtii]PQC28571.1 hypothetical protein CUM97_13165 [Enterococcus mundtii]
MKSMILKIALSASAILCAISCLNVSQPVGAEEIHPTAGETDFIGAFAISGSDVVLEVGETSNENILTASHARITNSSGVEVPPIIKSANVQDTPGIYQATIGTTIMSSVEKEITVTVVDKLEDCPTYGIYQLTADDATVPVGQVDEAAILQATNAQALTSGGSPVDVVIKKSNVVNDTPGTYQIVLGIKEEPKIRKTVQVTVTNDAGNEQESLYFVDASDATVSIDQLDEQTLIIMTNAKATDILGHSLPVEIKHSTIKFEPGNYTVTFGLKGDSSLFTKTVNLTVTSDNYVPSRFFLQAFDATVQLGQTDDLSLIQATGANAVTLLGQKANVYVKHSSIEANKTGEFAVTFGVTEDPRVEKTVTVSVVDEINRPELGGGIGNI